MALGTVAAPAWAKLLTCRDWRQISAESKAVYVHGMREGITLGTTQSAISFLAELPPDEQLEAAEEVMSDLVADAPISAYVSKMTTMCADPIIRPGMPLAIVFLGAGEQLRARGAGTVWRPPLAAVAPAGP